MIIEKKNEKINYSGLRKSLESIDKKGQGLLTPKKWSNNTQLLIFSGASCNLFILFNYFFQS